MAMFLGGVNCGWESGTMMRNVLPLPLALLIFIYLGGCFAFLPFD
jgi:hypothetical protein